MAALKFSINLSAPVSNLIKLGTDYENFPKYLPQLKEVKILERNEIETITNETFEFKTIRKKIEMKTIHRRISENKIHTEIITGPAKGSIMLTEYIKTNSGTQVNVDINLKLDIKTKFFLPIIKQIYKVFLTGVLYKMNFTALQQE